MFKIYDIAGLKVAIKNPVGRTEKQARPYLSKNQDENQHIDIKIDVTKQRLQEMMKKNQCLSEDDWFYMISGNDFYVGLLNYNGILLHSSCVVVDGNAYAFSADSGTGKSTHTQLWLKKFKDRAYMLNDDKPAIREINGNIYACGTPWSGKYDYSVPKIVPLAGIAFLERSENNWIKEAETTFAIFSILNQSTRKLYSEQMEKEFDTLEKLFNKIKIYQFGCNISEEAVNVSYNAMKPKNQ